MPFHKFGRIKMNNRKMMEKSAKIYILYLSVIFILISILNCLSLARVGGGAWCP